jgi:hypothetical protein
MFPVNRVVALLTPVFALVASVVSAWLLKHFPGVPLPSSAELVAGEVAGATAVVGPALSWLKGHQAYEKRLDEGLIVAKKLEQDATKADPGLVSYVERLVEAKVKALTNDNPTPDLTGLTVETTKPAVADNSTLAPQYATPTPPPAATPAAPARPAGA